MNLETASPGYAFEGDYPESYGESMHELQQVVRGQLDELERIGTPARSREVLGVLRGRRGHRAVMAQLEVGYGRNGSDCLLARGEVVMPCTSYHGDVRRAVEKRGYEPHDAITRRSGLVRLRDPAKLRHDVEQILDECSRLGASAWANYVLTMAAVGKGIGGPEPVGGPGAFASAGSSSEASNPVVAIIDTGIVKRRRTDGWLDGIERSDGNVDRLDVLPLRDGYLDFQAGHGTFVAGIVQRVAPEAAIRVYRAADTDGFATDDDIAEALLSATEDGATIINLSLAGRTLDNRPPQALADAVATICSRHGDQIVIVAAAGNYGDSTPCWPAALPGVEAVAGLTARLTPARWSSYGTTTRFSTVAEGIRSTFVAGRESPVFDRDPDTFVANAWALWCGTSFAAPQIAGAVARICRELDKNPREAIDLLQERGKPIDGFGSAMRILEGTG